MSESGTTVGDEPLPTASSVEEAISEKKDEEKDEGPSSEKRRKIEQQNSEKLEYRLGGILCCAVCLDLPPAAVYQCNNGHLMCAACFNHLLADARLRDEAAACPNCRADISRGQSSRNLAVENTISELPADCNYCTKVFPRHSLNHHEKNVCVERVTRCKYYALGCEWRGAWREAEAHEAACALPSVPGAAVLKHVLQRTASLRKDIADHQHLVDLLSLEKITFQDVQLRPYRTDEFVHRLYYESSRFSAFGHQWAVQAFVNREQRDPTQSANRDLTYQLLVKSKVSGSVGVQWVVVRGPHGEAALTARPAHHSFSEAATESPPMPLPLADPTETNRLLAAKHINLRLIMFLTMK